MDPKQCAFDHAPHAVVQAEDGTGAYGCPVCHARWILTHYDAWVLTDPPDVFSDAKAWDVYLSGRKMDYETRLGRLRAESARCTAEVIEVWLDQMAETFGYAGGTPPDVAQINNETIMVVDLIRRIREGNLTHGQISPEELFGIRLEPDAVAHLSERKLRALEKILGSLPPAGRRHAFGAALRMAASDCAVQAFRADAYQEINRDSGLMSLDHLLQDCDAGQITPRPGGQEEPDIKRLTRMHAALRERRIRLHHTKKKQAEDAFDARYRQVRIIVLILPIPAIIAALLILDAYQIQLPQWTITFLIGISIAMMYFSDFIARAIAGLEIDLDAYNAWNSESDREIVASSRKLENMKRQIHVAERQRLEEERARVNAARQTIETARDSLVARLEAIAEQEIRIHEDRMIAWCGEMLNELPEDLRPVSYHLLELYR